MKALIVAPSWIGDTIMAQPLFARLHASHPNLRLDALAPQWVAPVLQRMAEIEEVVASPFGHGQLALVPFMAGIPRRIGFTGESRFGLINIRHDIDKVALPLMVERFAQLAEPPGAQLPRPISHPKIRSTAADQERTLSELGLERPLRIAGLCPGAEYGPAKRWPARHFAALARKLAETGYAI